MDFLDTARVGHLATADTGATPHLIPVTFVRLDDAIYIPIDEKPKTTTRLKRVRNIEENPQAALLVDVYDEDWSQLRWVLIRGRADVLEPGLAPPGAPPRDEILAELRAKYPQYHRQSLAQRPIIRLHIDRVTEWAATPDDPD